MDQRVRATDFRAERILTLDTVPVFIDAISFWLVWSAEKEENLVRRGFDVLWGDKPSWQEEKTIHYRYWVAYSLAYALKTGKDANRWAKSVR